MSKQTAKMSTLQHFTKWKLTYLNLIYQQNGKSRKK